MVCPEMLLALGQTWSKIRIDPLRRATSHRLVVRRESNCKLRPNAMPSLPEQGPTRLFTFDHFIHILYDAALFLEYTRRTIGISSDLHSTSASQMSCKILLSILLCILRILARPSCCLHYYQWPPSGEMRIPRINRIIFFTSS